MILLLITKAGVVFPIKIPNITNAGEYLAQLTKEDWINGVEARGGEPICVRISEVTAMQITDEAALEQGRILRPQGRVQ